MKADCSKCKYYAVTWQPKFPHACKLLDFKSKKIPSIVAFDSTGAECVGFEPKEKEAAAKPKSPGAAYQESVIVEISKG